MKKHIVIGATFVFGLFYFLEYVIPTRWQTVKIAGQNVELLSRLSPRLSDFLIVVMVFSIGLGWANLLATQWKKVRTGSEGRLAPIVFFLSTIVTLLFGFWYKEVERRPWGPAALAGGHLHWLDGVWGIIRDQVNSSLIASVFSLLAFYIASAAYRAFKVKSLDASLMMAAAMIVMLGNVPVGNALTAWAPKNFQLPTWTMWIMNYVNTPASRAMGFGIAIGIVAISLRLWLSLERGAFFEREL
jgi:hypothetical protein